MRRIALLALLLLAQARTVAQDYVPMTTPGSRWLYQHISVFNEYSLEAVDVLGDTVLDGVVYKKMGGWWNFGMRDNDGLVWIRPYGGGMFDTVPMLAYDFTLAVGDTFRFARDPDAGLVVTARDTVQMLDGTYRDRMHVQGFGIPLFDCYHADWIEGMGDKEFIWSTIIDCFELGFSLECYGINDVRLWGSCMWLNTEERADLEELRATLDEGGEALLIQGPTERIRSVSLVDAAGRVRGEWKGPITRIPIGELVSGSYWCSIRTAAGVQVEPFVRIAD